MQSFGSSFNKVDVLLVYVFRNNELYILCFLGICSKKENKK